MLLKPLLSVTPQPMGQTQEPSALPVEWRVVEGAWGGVRESIQVRGSQKRREPSLGGQVHTVEVAPDWSEGQSLGEKSELVLQKQGLPIWRVRVSGGLNSRGRVASC